MSARFRIPPIVGVAGVVGVTVGTIPVNPPPPGVTGGGGVVPPPEAGGG